MSGLGIRLIVIIKTIASNRLTTTSRARLQITAKHVKLTSWHTAIVTLWELQVIGSTTVTHSGKLLAVDNKMCRYLGWHLIAAPS